MNVSQRRHHPTLERRASAIVKSAIDGDVLMNSRELGQFLGFSVQWVEIGRQKGYGPPFVRIANNRVRYRKDDVLAWLASLTPEQPRNKSGAA